MRLHFTIGDCNAVIEGFDLYNSRLLCLVLGNVNSLYILYTYSNSETWMKIISFIFLRESALNSKLGSDFEGCNFMVRAKWFDIPSLNVLSSKWNMGVKVH